MAAPKNANGAGASNGSGAPEAKCPVNHSEKAVSSKPAKSSSSAPKEDKSEGMLAKLKTLRQMSKRPVPTAYGDGTYPKTLVRPKLRDDLSRIGMNGELLSHCKCTDYVIGANSTRHQNPHYDG